MKEKNYIAIATGGSGGHVFPALACYNELLKLNTNVKIFADKRVEKLLLNTNTVYIKSYSNSKNLLKFVFILFIGFLQSFFYLIKKRPKAILSFGSYASLPILISAIILRVPIYLHEQNAVLSKVNRLMYFFCNKLLLGFNKTLNKKEIIKIDNKKVFYTGNPVREEFSKHNTQKKGNFDNINILILGGSQGAKILSTLIPSTFALLNKDILKKLIVNHQCRQEYIDETKKLWFDIKVNFTIKPFFNNIQQLIEDADIIITRSGASTIAEINAIGRYAIYIPFAASANSHQKMNAYVNYNYIKSNIILEKNLNKKTLLEQINNSIKNIKSIYEEINLVKKDENGLSSLNKIIKQII